MIDVKQSKEASHLFVTKKTPFMRSITFELGNYFKSNRSNFISQTFQFPLFFAFQKTNSNFFFFFFTEIKTVICIRGKHSQTGEKSFFNFRKVPRSQLLYRYKFSNLSQTFSNQSGQTSSNVIETRLN